ncbi:unnamed protein product [Clonostachys rosea f. rosea IK726]|uniref:Phosphatidic acid phosphatase type 2/haloperoxidase domain-containing protein n=2 Tax=Bionectria ochroleuca TaxID=29856 RepID=A0A0B7KA86_BIOOC|nr:unnamed protein product [Clonostachys rosea f. rosea IK726]
MDRYDNPAPASFSKRLILSYAFDWLVLIVVIIAAVLLGRLSPTKRPFSLEDQSLTFPRSDETVPIWLAMVLCVLVPLVIIFLFVLLLVPGANSFSKPMSRSTIIRRKLWEIHVGWLGLALSVIIAFFTTETAKGLLGKPRPYMLSVCDPDLANAADHLVGSGKLYAASICRQTDTKLLNEAFRSFPSGHSSCSAAGLTYLSLFLASKLRITTPFFPRSGSPYSAGLLDSWVAKKDHDGSEFDSHTRTITSRPRLSRTQAAAPPIYLLALCLVPIFLAIFIAASRWFNFMHHGFDVIVSFLVGLLTAFLGFSYYHTPISVGSGWAWGPREKHHAFWAGVGGDVPVEEQARRLADGRGEDVELGAYAGNHRTNY